MCVDGSLYLGFHAFVRNNVHCEDKHRTTDKQLVQGTDALSKFS